MARKLSKIVGILLVLFAMAGGYALAQGPYQRFDNILAQKLTVYKTSVFRGDVTFSGTGTDLTITGNLAVGNGTPSVTQDGEDAYIEGQLEVDGEAQFDGAIDANSSVKIDGGLTDIGTGSYLLANGDNDLGVAGDFEVDGASRFDATITQSDGDTVVADDLRIVAQTAITVTDAAAFTATGTYQPIQAAGAVTPSITAGTAGQVLVLVNISAQNILIVDTGNQVLAGNVTLGQYDSLTLWADGTRWVEISRSNN